MRNGTRGPSVLSGLGARTAFLLPPFGFHRRRLHTLVSSSGSPRGICFNFASSARAPAARSPPPMDLTVLGQRLVGHSSSDPPVRGRSAGRCTQHVADAPRRGVRNPCLPRITLSLTPVSGEPSHRDVRGLLRRERRSVSDMPSLDPSGPRSRVSLCSTERCFWKSVGGCCVSGSPSPPPLVVVL